MTSMIQINDRGTLTLPKPMRKAIGLDRGGTVVAEATDGGIILRPSVTFPIEIFKDQPILGGAVGPRCTYLWTDDKHHFGPLYGHVISGTCVVSGPTIAGELIAAHWL